MFLFATICVRTRDRRKEKKNSSETLHSSICGATWPTIIKTSTEAFGKHRDGRGSESYGGISHGTCHTQCTRGESYIYIRTVKISLGLHFCVHNQLSTPCDLELAKVRSVEVSALYYVNS
jgi:hypothetical protein